MNLHCDFKDFDDLRIEMNRRGLMDFERFSRVRIACESSEDEGNSGKISDDSREETEERREIERQGLGEQDEKRITRAERNMRRYTMRQIYERKQSRGNQGAKQTMATQLRRIIITTTTKQQ